jgi:sugar-specific transcriptional regulator TrmB
LNSGEKIGTLTRLGLTLNQARAYLSLVQLGSISVKELSEASKITRQDVYRVMLELERKGLVEKLLVTPTVYRALPIKRVTTTLLTGKTEEHEDLQRKTRQLVTDVQKSFAVKTVQDEISQFIMTSGKDTIIQRLGEALSKASKTVDVVTSRERFSSAIDSFAKGYEKALSRGVKIRITAEEHATPDSVLEITRNLSRNKNFGVRFFSSPPEAIVTIFDGKEAMVTISKTANYAKNSALWSNDSGFVALARSYFENKWDNSAKAVKPSSKKDRTLAASVADLDCNASLESQNLPS